MAQPISREQQKARALQYMAQHGINELLEFLTALVAYHRPADVTDFLCTSLDDIRAGKFDLFSDSDIEDVFSYFDRTSAGYLNQRQFDDAYTSLGLHLTLGQTPHVTPSAQGVRVKKAQFVAMVNAEIQRLMRRWQTVDKK
eukprot:gnl/Ergobibamus_cyprinoides/870.p1 GENE.gnl/Ergobibamus_cyprinoides/870~~gnl/Ergobibamus_cyprinoides/870.p1  ORF type:complete len:141 (+),score=29.55 gnl/Ergobibamus_cyprinoides/870:80-502(+)